MNRSLIALAASLLLGGCSVLAPYDSKFQCERSRDYGKCVDVQGAYSEALGGTVEMPKAEPREAAEGQAPPAPADNFNRYKATEYGELARLIDDPVTPVVAPPKVLRTLIVAYATPERRLYMPRWVYQFVTDGDFVLGDYLNADQAQGPSTVYPNGAR